MLINVIVIFGKCMALNWQGGASSVHLMNGIFSIYTNVFTMKGWAKR